MTGQHRSPGRAPHCTCGAPIGAELTQHLVTCAKAVEARTRLHIPAERFVQDEFFRDGVRITL